MAEEFNWDNANTTHGQLFEARIIQKGVFGIPTQKRLAIRVDCGYTPQKCLARGLDRVGLHTCNLTPPHARIIHNLVTKPNGEYTLHRPKVIHCGKIDLQSNEVPESGEDPLLQSLISNTLKLSSLNLYKYSSFLQ